MEMYEIHPLVLSWVVFFMFWLGLVGAYVEKDDCINFIKGLGAILLLTGILMIGVYIGSR